MSERPTRSETRPTLGGSGGSSGGRRFRIPLLARLIASLLAVALVPLAISYYQIRVNREAVIEQVQRTHLVAAGTAAARLDAMLGELRATAAALAENPLLIGSPQSPAAQELLRGILQARSDVALTGLFDAGGETLVLAQRRDRKEAIAPLLARVDERPLRLHRAADDSLWLGVTAPVSDGALVAPAPPARMVIVADAAPLETALEVDSLGDDAAVALAAEDGRFLAGDRAVLEDLPFLVAQAVASGKVGAMGGRYRLPSGRNAVIAARHLTSAPWLVVSVQPAGSALVAMTRIRRGAMIATGGALLLAALLSTAGYAGFIRPLHNVIRAQRALVGVESGDGDRAIGGNEIEELESSFALLEQRIKDSEDLQQVFLGRFQIQEMVGKGSMGSVFKSWDPTLERPVALKTIRLDRISTDREELTTKLLHEAVTHARFSHPNIVTVYDVARKGTAAFIAMEYVDGTSLYQLLRNHGALPIDQVVPLGLAIARALAAAHDHELVHHDVKPGNILIGTDLTVKVTDFGVSQVLSVSRGARKDIVGTAGYLAPECLAGSGYDRRSDLFALGVVLYEALAGYNPIGGHNLRTIIANTLDFSPQPLHEVRPEVPAVLADLVHRLLERDPAKRPSSAQEVVEILEELVRVHGYSWQIDPRQVARTGTPAPAATRPLSTSRPAR